MGLKDRLDQLLQVAAPEVEAVSVAGTWWTWGQVTPIAREVDRICTSLGLHGGARVGVTLQNDAASLAVAIGVLASGRCITTLNPLQPPARLAGDIERATLPIVFGPHLVIGDRIVGAAIEKNGLSATVGVDGAVVVDGTQREWPDSSYSVGTAIEMATSGTTGPPKRINLAYAQLDSAFEAQSGSAELPKQNSSVAIVSAPLVHIGGLWHALNSVLAGRRLVLLDRFRVADWVDAVERYRPKVVSLVPAAVRAVLDADVPVSALTSVRAVTSGTAACPPDLAEAFHEKYDIPVLTTYGATEFAGAVAGWTLADYRSFAGRKRGSVGRPFAGVRIRAADEHGTEVAAGVIGRLQVSGAQLGDASAWVGTSDLGKVDADGFIFITGRADSAIVRGGFKVQPDTVVERLEKHPSVSSAAVVGQPHERLGKVPVAVVTVPEGARTPDEDELVAFCREALMPYEVPAQIAVVDEIPLTATLKVSGADILALFDERSESAAGV
ncbi:MAG: fatty acid--CoA ligase family protein [Rhodococcus fascians]